MHNGRRIPGVQLGIYRVKVSKQEAGAETIAAQFNAETEIGYEVSAEPDAGSAHFDLKR